MNVPGFSWTSSPMAITRAALASEYRHWPGPSAEHDRSSSAALARVFLYLQTRVGFVSIVFGQVPDALGLRHVEQARKQKVFRVSGVMASGCAQRSPRRTREPQHTLYEIAEKESQERSFFFLVQPRIARKLRSRTKLSPFSTYSPLSPAFRATLITVKQRAAPLPFPLRMVCGSPRGQRYGSNVDRLRSSCCAKSTGIPSTVLFDPGSPTSPGRRSHSTISRPVDRKQWHRWRAPRPRPLPNIYSHLAAQSDDRMSGVTRRPQSAEAAMLHSPLRSGAGRNAFRQ